MTAGRDGRDKFKSGSGFIDSTNSAKLWGFGVVKRCLGIIWGLHKIFWGEYKTQFEERVQDTEQNQLDP